MNFVKLLIHYMVRYFLGFLIVFLSCVMVASVAGKSMENYLIEQGRLKNQAGIDSIKEKVDKMSLINQMMSKNPSFTHIRQQKGQLPPKEALTLKEAYTMLADIGIVTDYVPYAFTLFKNNDMYISTGQCSSQFKEYYGRFLTIQKDGVDLTSAEALKAYFFDRYAAGGPFIQVDQVSYMYSAKEQTIDGALLYLTSDAYSAFPPASVSCFVMEPESIVDTIMMPEVMGSGFLYIQNVRNGEELLRFGEVPDGAAECRDGDRIAGEETYEVYVNEQKELGWKIVTGIPMSFVNEQLKPVYRLLFTYLFIGLLLVIVLTLYFSLQRYHGMKKVLFVLPDNGNRKPVKKRFDEYSLLTDNIQELKDKGEDYRLKFKELEQQKEAILLEHLIVSGIQTPEQRKVYETCFDKKTEFFCVALVRLYHQEYSDFKLATLHMTQYFKKFYKGDFASVYSGVSDELFLFQLNPNHDARVTGIKRLFDEIVPVLTQKYNVTFHIGVSAIGTDIANISKCYGQARQIVQAQFALGNENAIKAFDISDNVLYDNPISLEFLNRLSTLLLCGQQEEAIRELERVKGYYDRAPYLFELQKEQIFYSIRNVFYTTWLQFGRGAGFDGNMPDMKPDLVCEDMINIYKECVTDLCSFIRQSRKSKNEGLKTNIINYLQEHFPDAGLSAYTMSTAMGISEKYLSQFIKEQTGETFASYLLKLRIDKAKEYLETTGYSNEQIAELTGFGAVNTFYRNFNRQTGVTPKVYKNNLKRRSTGRHG